MVDLIMGPTRNHVLRYIQQPLDAQAFGYTWYFAMCGYRTCDEERFNNETWAEAPTCKRCENSSEGRIALASG